MERRTTTVVERLRRFTNLGLCDSDGKVSLSKETATILEDLCGEAADMIIALREQIDKETVITVDPKYPPFGSFGDSLDLDEFLKKYGEYEQQTFSNLQSEVINPGDNCMQPTWSWSSSTATNQTGGEEK